MDMDGTSLLMIGMGVGTVTKECGGAQSRSQSRPVAMRRRGVGGGWLVFRRGGSGVIFRSGWSIWCVVPASMVQGMVLQPFN